MKLSAKLLSPLFITFLILASQARVTLGIGTGDDVAISNRRAGVKLARSLSDSDSVQIKFVGREEGNDTTLNISSDSAASFLKGTRASVFFVNHVRFPKKKVTKIARDSIASIEVAYGFVLIKQYGDEAKEGIVTLLTGAKEKATVKQRQAFERNKRRLEAEDAKRRRSS